MRKKRWRYSMHLFRPEEGMAWARTTPRNRQIQCQIPGEEVGGESRYTQGKQTCFRECYVSITSYNLFVERKYLQSVASGYNLTTVPWLQHRNRGRIITCLQSIPSRFERCWHRYSMFEKWPCIDWGWRYIAWLPIRVLYLGNGITFAHLRTAEQKRTGGKSTSWAGSFGKWDQGKKRNPYQRQPVGHCKEE